METKSEENPAEAGKVDLKHHFIEMRAKGYSIRRIAKKLRLSPQTLSNWQAEMEEQIAALKAIELEALFEQYHLLKEHRVKLIGDHIRAIHRELKQRNLSDISTEKLLDVFLKYLDEAGKEVIELKPLSDEDISSLGDKTGTKMDSQDVSSELVNIFARYRNGLISDSQARQEVYLLQAILKAEDQTDIQNKLDKLESLLDGRK